MVDITPYYLNPLSLGRSRHMVGQVVWEALVKELDSLSTLERRAVLIRLQETYNEYGDKR